VSVDQFQTVSTCGGASLTEEVTTKSLFFLIRSDFRNFTHIVTKLQAITAAMSCSERPLGVRLSNGMLGCHAIDVLHGLTLSKCFLAPSTVSISFVPFFNATIAAFLCR